MLSNIKAKTREFTKNRFWLRCCLLTSYNVFSRALVLIRRQASTGHDSQDPRELDRYEQQMFDNYKRWLGIAHFYGKAAELGPGRLVGVGERLLADGCSHVDLVDRFVYPHRDTTRLNLHYGVTAERFFGTNTGYDFIVSTAVLEHLLDPLAAIRTMGTALNPGGTMIHVVDCRDHGQFSDHMHDLSFLRVPRPLYFPMKASGGPNRIRLSAYLTACNAAHVEPAILIACLSGIAPDKLLEPTSYSNIEPSLREQSRVHVASIRPKLSAQFRCMSDMDLMVSGFVLIAKRPL